MTYVPECVSMYESMYVSEYANMRQHVDVCASMRICVCVCVCKGVWFVHAKEISV